MIIESSSAQVESAEDGVLRVARSESQSVAQVMACLRDDGVVVLPADTMYGLSTRLSSASGHRRILQLKGYAARRPLLYLAYDVNMVARYIASWGCTSRDEMHAVWPGPLTAILPGFQLPEWVGPTIAFRVPGDMWLRQVVRAVGEPLASTSINPVGESPLLDAEAIAAWVGNRVDLMVTTDRDVAGTPSTVVDFTGERPVVVRAGAYPWAARGNPSN